MNPTLARPRRPQTRPVGQILVGAVVVVATVVGVVVTTAAVRRPSFVPRLSIANPTAYQVELHVTDGGRDGWLDLGSVRREATESVYELIDQGDEWVFRFAYGGAEAGELVVSRAQLEADGWRVTVPAVVGGRLRDAGLRPSAR